MLHFRRSTPSLYMDKGVAFGWVVLKKVQKNFSTLLTLASGIIPKEIMQTKQIVLIVLEGCHKSFSCIYAAMPTIFIV